MFMPYGRILAVHASVLVGGFLAASLGSPLVVVALLAMLKAALEIGVSRASGELQPVGA